MSRGAPSASCVAGTGTEPPTDAPILLLINAMTNQTGGITVRTLGKLVRFRSDDSRWMHALRPLWDSLAVEPGSEPDWEIPTYEVKSKDQRHEIRAPGRQPISYYDPWLVLFWLRSAVLRHVIADARATLFLHAAVVARGASGLLLSGPGGVGKSTLTIELLRRGWTYSSDDLAPIKADRSDIARFPHPISIKNLPNHPGYETFWAPPQWMPRPTYGFLIPPSVFDVAKDDLQARCLVFPRFKRGVSMRLEPLTAAHAMTFAARNLAQGSRPTPMSLEMLRGLCSSVMAAQLTYGSTEDAVSLLEDFVTQ